MFHVVFVFVAIIMVFVLRKLNWGTFT